jgi:Flp pilus assembly protein TadD
MTDVATFPFPEAQQQAHQLWQQGVEYMVDDCPLEAVAALRECLVLHPGLACAWNDLGVLMEVLGNYAQARDCYASALQAEPKHREAQENYLSLALRFDLMQALHRAA